MTCFATRNIRTAVAGPDRRLLMLVMGLAGALAVQAQPLRDPTLAPAQAGMSQPDQALAAPAATPLESGGFAVLVRNGVPHLVIGTRLYTQGQSVGPARIERITETAVWLRESGSLRRVPVFAGIERHAAAPASAPKQRSAVRQSHVKHPSGLHP